MIGLGSDHAGFEFKQQIIKYLCEKGIPHKDYGTYSVDSVDYPDFAEAVCKGIQNNECDKGLLICGTGIGISIAANKCRGIRAALCSDTFSARASREHNDANVLCLGARVIGIGVALDIIDIWLKTEFQGGRHSKRIDKINELEKR